MATGRSGIINKFRSRRWGSSLPVCARLTVRSSPHRHERKFFGARVWGGGENQRILRTFLFFQKKINLGGGKIFKIFCWSIFSPNQAILSTFRFFHFFQKKNNCGHYFCLPSTKIVVTMFACHLHSSDQSCVCGVTFKDLPQPLRSNIQSFGTIFSQKNLKKT